MKIRRLLIIVVCALTAGMTFRYGANKFTGLGSITGHTAPLKEPVPAYTRSLRPNYPYSIIPGGAYSAAELRYAHQLDPLVREHYAGFEMKKVQMVRLTEDRYQYVSYRLHQKVYWTKGKLRIPKGELLLTDGTNWARARCGNRLSEKPQSQVSIEEPPAKALSMPPMHLGTPMELAETPPLGELSSIPPVINNGNFPPVLPPSSAPPPPELPSLAPPAPVTPVLPMVSILYPPLTLIPTNNPTPLPPLTPPIGSASPPIIPPTNDPPVSTVPEPRAIYLFLVTFVLSLYGLTRIMQAQEKTEPASDDENH
jgi:hypothetical protein